MIFVDPLCVVSSLQVKGQRLRDSVAGPGPIETYAILYSCTVLYNLLVSPSPFNSDQVQITPRYSKSFTYGSVSSHVCSCRSVRIVKVNWAYNFPSKDYCSTEVLRMPIDIAPNHPEWDRYKHSARRSWIGFNSSVISYDASPKTDVEHSGHSSITMLVDACLVWIKLHSPQDGGPHASPHVSSY